MLALSKHLPDRVQLPLHAVFRLSVVAFVVFGVAGIYYVAAVPGEPFAENIGRTLQYFVSPWMLATEAIAAGFLAYGFIFLRSSPWKAHDATAVEGLLRRERLRLLLVMSAFSLGLLGICAFFAFTLNRGANQQALVQTETIARQKAQQVDKWLFERSIEAQLVGASLQRIPLDQWSSNGELRQIVGVMLSEILAGRAERVAVTIFAPDGKTMSTVGEDVAFREGELTPETWPGNRLRLLGTNLIGNTPPRYTISFVRPIMMGLDSGTLVALLAITVDPSLQLVEQLSQWPVPNTTGEVLLLGREADDVVFITRPRLLKDATNRPGSARAPLSTRGLLAAEPFLHGDGVRDGKDFRGVDVLTASAQVQGIDWHVMAKINLEEALGAAHRQIRVFVVVVLGSILLAGVMVATLWHGQRAGLLAFRAQQEQERAALIRHYDQMVASVRDSAFLTDARVNILEANNAAVKRYGYSVAEFRTMNGKDLRAPEERAKFEQQWHVAVGRLGDVYETVHRRKDGATFPVEIANNAFEENGKTYYQVFIRDISVRKSLEQRLVRAARAQKAIYEITEVLLEAGSEDELYRGMCDMFIDSGGYSLVGVAVPNDDDGKTVRFLAIAGKDDGYLAKAKISWGEGPWSQEPTGAAIREGRIHVVRNVATDPLMAPWRDAALARGLQACIALPLFACGKVYGAFTLYSDHPDAFDGEELAVLTRFAGQISHRVEALRAGRAPASSQHPPGASD